MAEQELKELITGEIKRYPGDFIVLGLILLTTVISFLLFSYDPYIQEKIVLALAMAYFWWGVFHHWRKDGLDLKVVLEYLILAILGAILIIFVLLRA